MPPGAQATARRIIKPKSTPLSTLYNPANEAIASTPKDAFSVDPNAVDRGLIGHMKTQNALARFAENQGWLTHSPGAGDPDFDLAWEEPGRWTVVEVKSLTETNQASQIRLGLGQVLDYHHSLEASGRPARAVLALEREPADRRWRVLCARYGVALVWPAAFDQLG